MLASGLAYAQSPAERKEEPKRTEEPANASRHGQGTAQEHGQGAAQERGQERSHEGRTQGERAQGSGREETGSPRQSSEEKSRPVEHSQQKAQESREPSRERNRDAEKQGRESTERNAETSGTQKSTEGEKSRTGAAGEKNERTGAAGQKNERTGATGQQNERTGAAANQKERDQPERNAAEKQSPAPQGNRPATATDTTRPQSGSNAQNSQTNTNRQTDSNQANQTTSNTRGDRQSQVTTEKQVRMSETFSRERLAAPERNLNISIRVGESVPSHVSLHRLPPEIVSIEPQYRDYEYFSTDDEVVIVEPGSHRIVSQLPRDPSRARAQLSGGSAASSASTGTAASGRESTVCRIMRRDGSGNVTEVEPSTVGSNASSGSLSVTVQLAGGGSSAPIALGAPAGDIVVATQGQGDCSVTLEPQAR
jgi:hypothetical protein